MLHSDAGSGSFRLVRAGVFGIWMVLAAQTPLHQLATLPDFLLAPPGVLALLPGAFWDWFMAPAGLTGFRIGSTVLFAFVAFSRTPHRGWLLLGACAALLFHGTLLGVGGFLNHARFGFLYAAILVALAPMGKDRNAIHVPELLRLAALLLATAYSMIGLHRVFMGGAAIFTGDALPIYMLLRTVEPGNFTFELAWWVLSVEWLLPVLKAGFLVTSVAEILSPLAVFHRRFRLAWLAVIVPFHFVTLLTMNIFFWENLILIALLFTDLPTLLARRLRLRGEPTACHHTPTPEAAPAA